MVAHPRIPRWPCSLCIVLLLFRRPGWIEVSVDDWLVLPSRFKLAGFGRCVDEGLLERYAPMLMREVVWLLPGVPSS